MSSKNGMLVCLGISSVSLLLSCQPQTGPREAQLDAATNIIAGSLSAGVAVVGVAGISIYRVAKTFNASEPVGDSITQLEADNVAEGLQAGVPEVDFEVIGQGSVSVWSAAEEEGSGIFRSASLNLEALPEAADMSEAAAITTEAMEATAAIPDAGVFFSVVEVGEEAEGAAEVFALLDLALL